MTAVLAARDVVARAGTTRMLDGVDIAVAPGRIMAVVGPNAAGKTTLLDVLAGSLAPATGRVERGEGVSVGRVFQASPLPDTLTVWELARLAGGGADLLERFGLAPHHRSFVGELSTGMRRILDLALATAARPSVLLLDEPSSGLAPAEVEHLARVITRWRDDTGGAVVVVDHDPTLVRAVADEVVVLDGGRVSARGPAASVLAAAPAGSRAPRIHAPGDLDVALAAVRQVAAPPVPPTRRQVSTWKLLRLGLRELAAGMGSVLILGVLNRVMKVELGISLVAVATILASYNLAAPVALAIGHRSDTHPIRGRRRTPYILAGAVLTAATVASAPHVAGRLAGGLDPAGVGLAVALFVAMGVGMYGSGAVFFALLADIAPAGERAHAASIVYTQLLAGILIGVGITAAVVDGDGGGLGTLFGVVAVLILVLNVVAVWGQEPSRPHESPDQPGSLREAVAGIAAIPQARRFFVFMVASTVFLFLQQAVLEPFGGEVLGLDVRQTAAFNAVLTAGTLIGMVSAGRGRVDLLGHRRAALWSLLAVAAGFGALALAAAAEGQPPIWLTLFFIGVMSGVFNVSVLALMMNMADEPRTALFMGAWTLAHALAQGLATAGGGVVHDVALRTIGGDANAYAMVFAVEAAGLVACIPLLRTIRPERFAAQADDTR
jgi:MFS transporter, BCD family, chlorophyll transporter